MDKNLEFSGFNKAPIIFLHEAEQERAAERDRKIKEVHGVIDQTVGDFRISDDPESDAQALMRKLAENLKDKGYDIYKPFSGINDFFSKTIAATAVKIEAADLKGGSYNNEKIEALKRITELLQWSEANRKAA